MSTEVSVTKRKGIFPGYLTIIAGAIMMYWGAGIHMYSSGTYVNLLTKAFGWSRAEVSVAFSLARFEGGIEAPIGGIAIDKWGPRVVNIVGFILLGLGFGLMYYINSLWMFYVAWVVAALGYNLGMMRPLDAALANWFVRRRGFMVALMNLGLCFSGPTMTPFVMWLLLHYAWRDIFLYLGVATILIGVPLTWFFIKPRRPEYYGWLPDGRRVDEEMAADTEATIKKGVEYAAAGEEVEFTVRQAMRDKTIWIMCISGALNGMAFSALMVHTIPFLLDMGIDPIVAATAMGTTVFMRFPTQLLFGWLGDRCPKGQLRYWVMLGHAISALGLFILIRATSMAWIWAYAVVYGLGHGATMGMGTPLRGRYWGRKAFATIAGVMAPFGMVAAVIAPVYAGWVYDTTDSYTSAFNLILVFAVLAIGIFYFATPPKPPKVITGITDVV